MKQIIIFIFVGCFLVETILAHPAWGIVVDNDRNIYFADIGHNGMGSVWKFTNQGELKLLLQNFHAHNVNLDQDNHLITAHGETTHTMVRVRQNGSIDTLYHTDNYKEFFGGNCVWSAKNEKIIYGLREHKYLRELDTNGTQKNIGNYEFKWNQSIYVSPEGTIYATEIGVDNGCVVKIDTNGESTFIARNLITQLDRKKDKHNDILLGITEGSDGYIYLAETAGKRIIKILGNGLNEIFYQADNNWTPTAIHFFMGDAYILEYKESGKDKGPRIVRIEETGNKTVLFNYDTYNKAQVIPISDSINNIPWWIIIVLGIFVMTIVFGLKERINYRSKEYNSKHVG